MKKIVCNLVALFALLTALLIGAEAAQIEASGFCGGEGDGTNLSWTLLDDGTLIISGTGAMEDFSFAPWYDYDNVTEVVIGNEVTSIGNRAFYYCNDIETVNISKSVTEIGTDAFNGCWSLENIVVDTGNQYFCDIDGVLFNEEQTELLRYPEGKTQTTYTVPNTVTVIGEGAFQNSELQGITMQSGIITIEDSAFEDCDGLTQIKLPVTLQTLGSDVFTGCDNLAAINGTAYRFACEDGVLFNRNKTELLYYPGGKRDVSYTVPDGVTVIGEAAFAEQQYLEEIILCEGITTIEASAFERSSITGNLMIPDTVTTIGQSGFARTSITGLTLGDGLVTIGGGAFASCTDINGSLVLPDTIETIEYSAFSGCSGLSGSLVIPDGVRTIGNGAFSGCSGLTGSLVIPDSVKSIGMCAFQNCTGFNGYLMIGTGIKEIETLTFGNCSGFTRVTLGENLTQIGSGAFSNCTGLTGKLTIPTSVVSIDRLAFSYCENLTRLSLNDGLEEIGDFAFEHCESILGTLTLPDSLCDIGEYAFALCTNMTGELVLPEGLTELKDGVFLGCSGFTGMLTIPESITAIGDGTLSCCTGLDGIRFLGDAPTANASTACSASFDWDTTLYYAPGTSGWTDSKYYDSDAGTWKGYELVLLCDHIDTGIRYSANGSETHLVEKVCDACDTVLETTQGNCTDNNIDFSCDLCGGAVACKHTGAASIVYAPNTNRTHNINAVCNYCRGIITSSSEACKDINADKLCDLCKGDLTCAHTGNTTVQYRSNGDGTHIVAAVCTTCGEDVFTSTMTCADNNSDNVCDTCKGVLKAPCEHKSTTVSYVPGTDKTHVINYVCVDCKEVVFDLTADCADADKDTACDACGATIVEITKISVVGANMTLGNELKVNFAVKKADLPSGAYAMVSQAGGEAERAELTEYNSNLKAVVWGVAAKEMSDSISVTIYNADGYAISDPYVRSVRDYGMTVMAGTKEALKPVVVDMLNYGAKAQVYFQNYNIENPANALITAAQQAKYATATVDVTNANQVKGTGYVGTNLTLEQNILMGMAFKGFTGSVDALSATVTFTDNVGTVHTDLPADVVAQGIYAKVVIDHMVLADVKCPITVKLFDAKGVQIGQGVDSVEGYVARNLNSSKTDLVALNDAIMKFATSAKIYLDNLNG